jgi:methionyl-tRNA synthetase
VLNHLAESLRIISILIRPFMEHTSEEIQQQLGLHERSCMPLTWEDCMIFHGIPTGVKVKKGAPMFKRLDLEKEIVALAEANAAYAAKLAKERISGQ